MNVRDSEIILGMLQKKGYRCARRLEEADVILFNTCSVREHAESRLWGQVGMLKEFVVPPKFADANLSRGDTRPNKKIIGLVGCMAQNYQEEIFRRMPHVGLVCGPANIYDIPDLLEKVAKGYVQVLAVDKMKRPLKTDCSRRGGLKAFVSIMYGCNNFCSYCIVPYVRGEQRSRPLKHVLDEVRGLAEGGCKEITLLGQNVNSYGKDLSDKINFVALLERLDRIKGIERIRFVTSHPKDASFELLKAMCDLPKVCEHLHLPLQAGSNKILRLMNRGYTLKDYLKLVDKLRELIPNCSLTSDIIVGFPGESDIDFKKTIEALQKIQFEEAFIFKYSLRLKTAAAKLKDDVALNVKQQRNQTLLKLQEEISLNKNKNLIGGTQEVLAEARGSYFAGSLKREALLGRSRTNKVTLFPGPTNLISQLIDVRINKVTTHTLIGEVNGKEA